MAKKYKDNVARGQIKSLQENTTNNLNLGLTNLITGTAENNMLGWTSLMGYQTGTGAIDTETFHSGTASYKITTSSNLVCRTFDIACSSGDKFYVSGWIRVTSGTNCMFYVLPSGATSGTILEMMKADLFANLPTGTWVFIDGIATATNGGIRVVIGRNTSQTFTVNFDDLMCIKMEGILKDCTLQQMRSIIATLPNNYWVGEQKIDMVTLSKWTNIINPNIKMYPTQGVVQFKQNGTVYQQRFGTWDAFNNVVIAKGKFLVRLIINGSTKTLTRSSDNGATTDKTLDVSALGTINYYHMFSDGALLFATMQKCYYVTSAWSAYTESAIKDENGNALTITWDDAFRCPRQESGYPTISGTEMAVWTNYSVKSGVELTNRIAVWYTVDKGVTVKMAYRFSGDVRHGHMVNWNSVDKSFWAQTGDEDTQCKFLKGTYTVATDTWLWTTIGSGPSFKSTQMVFMANGDIYFVRDSSPYGGLKKLPAGSDPTVTANYQAVFSTDCDCNGLVINSSTNEIWIHETRYGNANFATKFSRIFHYSPDGGTTWYSIEGFVPSTHDAFNCQYVMPGTIDDKGRVLAYILNAQINVDQGAWNLLPSCDIAAITRECGFPNAGIR